MSQEPSTVVLPIPNNLFSTPSPLVASWLVYSGRIQFTHYDADRRAYIFHDPNQLNIQLLQEYNATDPVVGVRRFYKTYKNLLSEKLKLDARQRAARKAVRRG